MAAAGTSVTAPLVAPLSASDLTPATAAASLTVTALFFTSLPVVKSKRATASLLALAGPTTLPPLGVYAKITNTSASAPAVFEQEYALPVPAVPAVTKVTKVTNTAAPPGMSAERDHGPPEAT